MLAGWLGDWARRYVGVAAGAVSGPLTAVAGSGRAGDSGASPDAGTIFEIGSVTKIFTALVLADAVVRGEVTLDQPVSSLIPGAASHPGGRSITLLDLATHASGLARVPPGTWRASLRHPSDPHAGVSRDALVAAVARAPRRPPGRVRYSSFGFAVLGEALARATGEPYERLVLERVCGPLGLTDTGFDHGGLPVERLATGHSRHGRKLSRWTLAAMAAAGGLRSSARDLLRVVRAHLRPEESPLERQIRMVVQSRLRVRKSHEVGLAWFLLHGKALWHNGGTRGFFSFVALEPGEGRGVAVLTNTTRSVDRAGFDLLRRLGASAGRGGGSGGVEPLERGASLDDVADDDQRG